MLKDKLRHITDDKSLFEKKEKSVPIKSSREKGTLRSSTKWKTFIGRREQDEEVLLENSYARL